MCASRLLYPLIALMGKLSYSWFLFLPLTVQGLSCLCSALFLCSYPFLFKPEVMAAAVEAGVGIVGGSRSSGREGPMDLKAPSHSLYLSGGYK